MTAALAPSRAIRPAPADRAFAALYRALRPHLGDHRLRCASSRDWASATFTGARHRLAITLEGRQADARALRLQAELGEAELPIAGGFVADLQIIVPARGDQVAIGIEALTIEESDRDG